MGTMEAKTKRKRLFEKTKTCREKRSRDARELRSQSQQCRQCDGYQDTVRKPGHSTENEGQVAVFDTVFPAAAVALVESTSVHKLLSFCNMDTKHKRLIPDREQGRVPRDRRQQPKKSTRQEIVCSMVDWVRRSRPAPKCRQRGRQPGTGRCRRC